MQDNTKPVTVSELLQFFPEVDLPVVFTDETLNIFSCENPPIPNTILQTVISEWEGELDEYTEIVPCVLVDSNEDYHALVYWKGGLLKYEFILLTIDARAETPTMISRKVIGSTVTENEIIKKSFASIDPDMIIHIIAGAGSAEGEYSADQSQAFTMEIQTTGDILFSFGDD